jgi:uncharacterized membrane protein
MSSKFVRYFFQGLLLVAPIALTIYVLYTFFIWIDALLDIKGIPGLGLIIILASLTFIGFLSSTFLVRPIVAWGERILNTIPIVNIIYSSVKDLLEAFVGNKKKFNHPVLVTLNATENVKRIGFVTMESVQELGINEDLMAVYLPHSYNISGNLYFVPTKNVQRLDLPAAEVMKFIVSGGISVPDALIASKKRKSLKSSGSEK